MKQVGIPENTLVLANIKSIVLKKILQMKYFSLLICLSLVKIADCQTQEKSFSLGGAKIFKVTIVQGSIINIKTKLALPLPEKEESISLTNLDKIAFIFQAENQITALTDASFVQSNKAETDSILKEIYYSFFPNEKASQKAIADSLAKVAAEDSLIYGRDEYYGLTNSQKDTLTAAMKALRRLQEKHYNIRKEAEHKGVWPFRSIDSIRIRDSSITIGKEINRLKRKISELKDFRQFQVSLIGNANVISSFKIAQQAQINGGFGIIVSKPNHIEFIGTFTISQSSDTIASIGKTSSDFGTSMLVPGVRKFSLLTSFRQRQLFPTSYSNFWRKIGIALNVNITPYNWAIRKTDNSADSTALSAKPIPAAMDLMFPFSWVNIYREDQEVCISTDVGFTCRYLLGDINKEQRKQFLGRTNNFYAGVIGGINIRYNGLRFQFHVPLLFGSHVDGLTGGQAYASMSFVARIVGPNSIKSLFK